MRMIAIIILRACVDVFSRFDLDWEREVYGAFGRGDWLGVWFHRLFYLFLLDKGLCVVGGDLAARAAGLSDLASGLRSCLPS